jgi:hypothetical protein
MKFVNKDRRSASPELFLIEENNSRRQILANARKPSAAIEEFFVFCRFSIISSGLLYILLYIKPHLLSRGQGPMGIVQKCGEGNV